MSLAMQQLLISWILIGILLLPADRVGTLQAIIGLPAVLIMLLGGAIADSGDLRRSLIQVYMIAAILPLYLAGVTLYGELNIATVLPWGFGMGVAIAYSMPAQQALLNRVSRNRLQQAVSIAMGIGFVVQVIGLAIAGQLDLIGLPIVLGFQSICLVIAAVSLLKLETNYCGSRNVKIKPWRAIVEGFQATRRQEVLFHVLAISALSSLLNAGSFYTVLPFIIKRLYEGTAVTLSTAMIVFFSGALVSSMVMYKVMPLEHPGRAFLMMQLTRVIVLILLWTEPSWWLFVVTCGAWGVNMGMSSTLARAIVQESAPPLYVGRIMSVFTLGLLGSIPIGAAILGLVIEWAGTTNALIPAIIWSILMFCYGRFATQIWAYQSPKPN